MREKLKTYIIQLFFIIVLLVTLFIGIFNTEAQAYAISAVLSFIHDGDYPLSAEPSAYFYEELVNTASYLCAQRGQHFFYERDVIINSTLDVEEIGQCYLEASTDAGNFYYACVKTVMGRSVLLEFGPVCEVPPATWKDSFFTFNRSNIAFDERKISRFIDKFLNNIDLILDKLGIS